MVLAHYMPWFRMEPTERGGIKWEHWNWFGKGPKHDPDDILDNGRRDIASVYYPLIGPYHGKDRAVLEYHMLTAKAAGIDGFVADWYGPDGYSDEVFNEMVTAAERYDMKVAICLEEKTFYPEYSGAGTRDDLLNALEKQARYTLQKYGNAESYLRWNGDPVFFMFNFWGTGPLGPNNLSPDEFSNVLDRLDERPIIARGGADTTYFNVLRGSYIWSADGKDRAEYYEQITKAAENGEIEYWVGGACPGFDDRGVWGWGGGPRLVDRRGTDEYRENWDEILHYNPPAVQLITWNDFEEGTIIEPTKEFGFEFIDLTEKYVNRYTGRKVNLADNQWPYRIYNLRLLAKSFPEKKRRQWNGKLDDYVSAFIKGRRFLMGWRLHRLESAMNKEAKKLKEKGEPS